jgi:hypothetical protein
MPAERESLGVLTRRVELEIFLEICMPEIALGRFSLVSGLVLVDAGGSSYFGVNVYDGIVASLSHLVGVSNYSKRSLEVRYCCLCFAFAACGLKSTLNDLVDASLITVRAN